MWLTAPNRIGVAAWQTGDSVWRFETQQGGDDGVHLLVGDERLSLVGSGDCPLPPLDEQYVRGQELHLSFPQASDSFEFGFRLVIRPVQADSIQTGPLTGLFEWLVSIQTSRLDSHPTLDLLTAAPGGISCPSRQDFGDGVYVAAGGSSTSAICLGRHDAPFTSEVDQAGFLRLRLFGQFLEKGVIRRARPWIFADRSTHPIQPEAYGTICKALAASPIPLD